MLKHICSIALLAVLVFAMSDTLIADDKAGEKSDAKAKVTKDASVTSVEPARLAAARKLIEVTGSAEQFDNAMSKVIAQLTPHLEMRASKKHKKAVGEVMSKMEEKFAKRSGELRDQIARLYAKRLPAEDLEEIVKFFSDGAGQRYLKAIPSLVEETAAVGEKWGQTIGREIQRDAEAELKKRGIRL